MSASTVPLVSSNPTGSYNPSPLLHDSLNPERKDLIKPFCLGLSEPRSLNLCTLPSSDLYTNFHLLQEEVSLMMAELWETLIAVVEQSVIRSHYFAMFLSKNAII